VKPDRKKPAAMQAFFRLEFDEHPACQQPKNARKNFFRVTLEIFPPEPT
jgi:hypothetical protein